MAFRNDHLILGNRKFDFWDMCVNIQYIEKRFFTQNYLDLMRFTKLGMDEKHG